MGRNHRSGGIGAPKLYVCSPCDKYSFKDRTEAKRARREMRQQGAIGEVLDVYRCPTDPTRWHIGHSRWRQRLIDEESAS